MYLGIDVGGSKTRIAVLDNAGQITNSQHFETPKDYDQFLANLKSAFEDVNAPADFYCVAGIPGHLNREEGMIYALGNLPWRDKPIRDDIAKIVGQPVIIENDSRLAGLSEARLIQDRSQNVLFATVSTGIGGALIQNGELVTALKDTEIGKMPLFFEGQYVLWEDFASGRGVVSRLHKKAEEITDEQEWQLVAEPLAYGLGAVCSTLQPEVIILGGPVGKHANRYSGYIMKFLQDHLHPVVSPPKAILAAQRPEEAGLYGCYELAKQVYGHA